MYYDFNKVNVDYDTEAEMQVKANVMGVIADNKITSRLKNGTSDCFSKLLPKVAFTYRIGNDNTIYALTSKGYRAGGYNIQMFSDILQSELNANSRNAMKGDYDVEHNDASYKKVNATIAYKPETSWNYEIGAHLNLLSNSLHLDLAAFYMNVSNQQLSVMAGQYGFGRMMVNAGKSNSFGLEATLNGRAFDNRLGWSVSYGFTRAVFKEYADSVKTEGKMVYKDYISPAAIPICRLPTVGEPAVLRKELKTAAI